MVKLTLEQRDLLGRVMQEKGVTQHDVTVKCSVSKSYVSQMFSVGLISQRVAGELYKILGAEQSLNFLLQLENMKSRSGRRLGTDYMWRRLFFSQIETLSETYQVCSTEEKGAILGNLEQLVEKYKKK